MQIKREDLEEYTLATVENFDSDTLIEYAAQMMAENIIRNAKREGQFFMVMRRTGNEHLPLAFESGMYSSEDRAQIDADSPEFIVAELTGIL